MNKRLFSNFKPVYIVITGAVENVRLYMNNEAREYEEEVDAVFVFIGSFPRTKIIQGLSVDFDSGGYIITDEKMETEIKGLFAAGDVRNTPFRQLIVAAAEGAIAAHSAVQYIDDLKPSIYNSRQVCFLEY